MKFELDENLPAHRIYNVVDDEAADLATLFASVGRRRPTARTPPPRAPSTPSSTAAASGKTSALGPIPSPGGCDGGGRVESGHQSDSSSNVLRSTIV
jgi:hypothetical protein